MNQKLFIIILLSLLVKGGAAQIFDKYGFNIGTSYSNQLWDLELQSFDSQNKEYKIGLLVFLSAEKKINERLSIRPEIGYIQKGFKDNMEYTLLDGTQWGSLSEENVILHDLGFNIGLKISPFNFVFKPYIILGFRTDYMFSYDDIILTENGSGLEFNVYKKQIEEFNKFNLGGLIGIGFELNNLTYLEFEYNPSITNSATYKILRIKDNLMGLKLGINMNKLIKRK